MSKFNDSLKSVLLAAAAMTLLWSTAPVKADTLVTTGYANGSQGFGISLNGNTSSPSAGAFAGTWNAADIVFWCIELTQYFGFGGNYTDYVATEPDNATFTMLGQLFTEAYGSTTDATHSAAFQLAIWEIVYDSDLDLHAGGFHVTSGDTQTIALAQSWLDALGSYTDNYHLIMLHSDTNQDFVTFGRPFSSVTRVPEPTPIALIVAALLGMLVVGRIRGSPSQGRAQA